MHGDNEAFSTDPVTGSVNIFSHELLEKRTSNRVRPHCSLVRFAVTL
ncbi:MAG: hypothetical protein FD169_1610 [Bacillota bacterium]|nr:MAG: hypothetical protein FD169_1610 [Bacillota bacterium]